MISLVLFPLCKSFPLHRCRRFAGHIVHHSIDVLYLIGNAVGDGGQDVVGDAGPVGGHEIVGGDGADGQEVVIGAVVAHDAHGADAGEDAEELGHLTLIAVLGHLIPENPVGLLEDFHLLGGDLADDAHAQAGAGEGLPPDQLVGNAQLLAYPADLILEEAAQGLDDIQELHILRHFDLVVVGLDLIGVALAGLDAVGVDGALGEEGVLAALAADPDVQIIRLAPVGKMPTLASIGPLPGTYPVTEFPIPDKGAGQLRRERDDCDQGLRSCQAFLTEAAKHLPSIHDQMLKTQNAAEYSSVSNTSQSQDGLVWLTGYIPAAEVEGFKKAAAQAHWAWAMEDPAADDDKVPTKVKYNKVTRLMIPVFDILGVVPGYREYDISFWFLGFFTLFFAMIIGDAGYGCLFLLAALVMTLKNKKASTAVQLLWLLSIATIVWGALTGTWFGLEQAMDVPLLKSLVIPTFANYPANFGVESTTQQNTIMKFCFILGTVQLSLACVMNIRRKLGEKDLSWLADLGWLAAIDALYFVVLYLVIGQQVNLMPVACVVIAGFLLVVLFGGMSPDKTFGQGLKAGLGDAFTVFLNTISAFGNIMSYIRLFAVGMASLAIAQSFNNMALGFKGPLVIAAILILLIGHGLNIVMGLLSVVVHGVRLNLLEFSGQLGMEWAGIAYDPFKKRDKIKK